MEQIQCLNCGRFFPKSPRHTNQNYCGNKECQKARKAAWQRYKMLTDPDYRLNRKDSNERWRKKNPDYWKQYRKKNPQKTERNRILQVARNRRQAATGNSSPPTQKIDTSPIAKMDALKANIHVISHSYR